MADDRKPMLGQVLDDIRRDWQWVISPRAGRQLDDHRWDASLAHTFPEFTVWNIGDGFNYSKCYSYVVLLHPGHFTYAGTYKEEVEFIRSLGGEENLLLLKLSVVAPYYLVKLLRRVIATDGTLMEQEVRPQLPEEQQYVSRAGQFAEAQGYTLIPKQYLNVILPDVKLELAESGQVTIYNCLFEDEYSQL